MTKTQALQRLFTALTDVPISEVANPTNTSTKMVELLAMAAENGDIGGGGGAGVAKMSVDSTEVNLPITDTDFEMMGVMVSADDILFPCIPSLLPPDWWSGFKSDADLPLYKGKGTIMASVGSDFTIVPEGDVEAVPDEGEGVYMYTGDFSLKIKSDK